MSAVDRMRSRVHAALAGGDAVHQAHGLLEAGRDAVADCEDDRRQQAGDMTFAEARSAYEACTYEEAVSIALEGFEVLYGESFLPDAVARPATLSATTLTLCQRALDARRYEIEHQLRVVTSGNFPGWRAEHEAELAVIVEALAELAAVSAATAGTSAA